MYRLLLLICFGLITQASYGQATETWRSWNRPHEPFQVIDNIYYVGASGIGAYLITTEEGHILLDGGFEETAPIILDNIATLGFDIADVKILLNSHAHFDHTGGLAALQEASGASFFMSEPDADLMENGGRGDFLAHVMGDVGLFPAVEIDRRLQDGDTVTLGSTTLTAHITRRPYPWLHHLDHAGTGKRPHA